MHADLDVVVQGFDSVADRQSLIRDGSSARVAETQGCCAEREVDGRLERCGATAADEEAAVFGDDDRVNGSLHVVVVVVGDGAAGEVPSGDAAGCGRVGDLGPVKECRDAGGGQLA